MSVVHLAGVAKAFSYKVLLWCIAYVILATYDKGHALKHVINCAGEVVSWRFVCSHDNKAINCVWLKAQLALDRICKAHRVCWLFHADDKWLLAV